MTIELLKVADIDEKHVVQLRAEMSEQAIADYADIYRQKRKGLLPPITVFRKVVDDSNGAPQNIDHVADGGHRLAGARLAGLKTIEAEIVTGDYRDALLYACGCNAKHGLRRTAADKRRAVQMLLGDPQWTKKSDRWIAEKCGVSNTFVGNMRNELSTLTVADDKRVGRDGKRRTKPKQRKKEPTQREQFDRDLDALGQSAAKPPVAPVDIDRVCPACEVGPCVVGQDRCEKCIRTGQTHPDDDVVVAVDADKPVVTGTLEGRGKRVTLDDFLRVWSGASEKLKDTIRAYVTNH